MRVKWHNAGRAISKCQAPVNHAAHPMPQDKHEAPWEVGQFPEQALQSVDIEGRESFQLLKEGGGILGFSYRHN